MEMDCSPRSIFKALVRLDGTQTFALPALTWRFDTAPLNFLLFGCEQVPEGLEHVRRAQDIMNGCV